MTVNKTVMDDSALSRAEKVLADDGASACDLSVEYALLAGSYRKLLRKFNKTVVISDSYESLHREVSNKLEEATHKYLQLKELVLPICMYCKKIRTDDDYWQRIETFFLKHADIMFSHGICPDCFKSAYDKIGMSGKKQLPGAIAAGVSASSGKRKPVEDDTLRDMRAIVRQRVFDGDPLPHEVEQLVEKYGKLLRRFDKIMTISDSYQSQLMELNSRLELMARTDFLTGLANRWEMGSRLDSEKSRADRYDKTFTLILADIDRFKAVNDTYGHLAGDRLLRAVSDVFKASLRNEDVCCRWGGEEFMVLLPETNIQKAVAVGKKLLDKIRATTVEWEGLNIGVTMSIGCGVYRPGMNIDELIKNVDNALYMAKEAGRDCVVTACG